MEYKELKKWLFKEQKKAKEIPNNQDGDKYWSGYLVAINHVIFKLNEIEEKEE